MNDIYILMLIALIVLAVIDLVVGVSNDAVNFLNSAIGSKAISLRNIMIIASFGIFLGAATSSGMMEVARKGIFIPGEFYFNEIMFIFMAVMITDILLLDVFNTLGMPTSTTVSIVFELLGAAVAMALIKISMNDNQSFADLGTYINSTKALEIILGILLSVVFAFSIGAIVQFISRLVYSFHFEKKKKYVNAIFGGIAVSAITYFIFMKGLKGTEYYKTAKVFIDGKEVIILFGSFVFWSFLGYLLTKLTSFNILKFIIGIGTFSLALAFAGNDLVNFIGVPIAALNSYQEWKGSGILPENFEMSVLAKKVPTQTALLFLAGGIMVITLWLSKKARSVTETEINLARQGDATEKFQPNQLSRLVVRGVSSVSSFFEYVLPNKWMAQIDERFKKPTIDLPLHKVHELPAFDMIRASVNLVVAGILISIATSYKLPLSTTYVTFMVAMGTSLADKAWGRESAVYRVAGVFSVIGGWFMTAISAFIVSGIFAYLIYLGGIVSVGVLLIIVFALIFNNYTRFYKKSKEKKAQVLSQKAVLRNINNVIDESSAHVAEVVKRVNKLYTSVGIDLSNHDLNKLKKNKKHVDKLNAEVSQLKNEVFYFIKSLDDGSVEASKFYILILRYIQDVSQSINYISTSSFEHVNNNHKQLKNKQVEELSNIDAELQTMLSEIYTVFNQKQFKNLANIIEEKKQLFNHVENLINKQVHRIRTEDTSPKNTTLYFGILLETKDLVNAILEILELFDSFHNTVINGDK